ncbi:MAG: EAL domain-containing protein, partial [bacterium]
ALEQGKGSQTLVIAALVAFGILLAAVLAWLLTRNVTNPVARLSRSVHALGQSGSLDARIEPTRASVELASLAGEINGMLDAVQAAQELQQEDEARYHAVIEQIADCILLVNPANKRLLEGNRAFWKLMGGEEDPPAWITLYEILPLEVSAVDKLVGQVLATRSAFLAEQAFRRLDGKQVELEASFSLLQMGGQEVLCLVARDLTSRKEAAARIEQMTFFDPLTGLPNRLYLRERLGHSIEAARQAQTYLALLLVDLDYFRNVNETLGHQAGDRLLTHVAERLRQQMGEGELARLGGDTFSVLLPGLASPAEAMKAAEGLQEILRAPFPLNGEELTITSSIGIALFPNDAADPETLLKYADSALHKAKSQGRNHSQFFRPAMNLEVTQFVELRNQLLRALEREELTIQYQPQADRQGRLAGAEALLRWSHPTLGQISPERFIPLAEETGLIVPIGEWVLQTVASQIRRWQREGRNPVRISINLSARQLQQPQVLLEQVSQALKRSGLDGSAMGLEITESLALRDLEVNLRTLGELRAMGLALSLDDFGTGYSAFSYLPRFPIAAIKIDRSFISPSNGQTLNPALLAGMVQIAHGLNLIVIAEGVEKPEQLQALLAMGCDGFQGMLLSSPLAVEAFGQLLRQGGCWPGFQA